MKDLIINLGFPVLAVSIVASLEVYALQMGVNGHGLGVAFTVIGTIVGAWIMNRVGKAKQKKGD